MLELAVIFLRLLQYGAASILTGSALFFIYGLPGSGPASAAALPWSKRLLAISALILATATALGLFTQIAVMAGSLAEALKPESLIAVLTGMDMGKAGLARAALACLAAMIIAVGGKGRPLWLTVATLGALASATFGWMGHANATEGSNHLLHLIADIIHVLAAATWLGALVVFVLLVRQRNPSLEQLQVLCAALHKFSALGIMLVASLVATGLINSWFLIGTEIVKGGNSPYGQLLTLKLLLFAGMFMLAALHRQRSVPAFAHRLTTGTAPHDGALASLRKSLAIEGALGFGVLTAVAWLGTLSPPALG